MTEAPAFYHEVSAGIGNRQVDIVRHRQRPVAQPRRQQVFSRQMQHRGFNIECANDARLQRQQPGQPSGARAELDDAQAIQRGNLMKRGKEIAPIIFSRGQSVE